MTVIGRREDCDLRIPLGEVSRKHCRLIKDGDVVRLEDLGSSNGTYHNGQRVQEAVLTPGDNVQVGPVTFVVQIDGLPADDDLQPPIKEPAQEGTGDFLPVEEVDEVGNAAPGPGAEVNGEPDIDELASAPEGSDFNIDADQVEPGAPTDEMVEFDLDEQHSSEDRPA
jgi:pSer/pThr/pTyr-binding forkhead associated (FHA) protein